MLSATKLKEVCRKRQIGMDQLAGKLSRSGFNNKKAVSAIRNWQKGLFKPEPCREDIRRLAGVLGVEEKELAEWKSSYRYAPGSARKARLVTDLIAGRSVQDALDVLKFTNKRAARMVEQVLKTAIADADEQQADVEKLYVSCARVDDAGRRLGTKTWIPKDRGRANPIRKTACHIIITVTEE